MNFLNKKEIIDKYKLNSEFSKIVKSRFPVTDYAKEYHYLIPKFNIIIRDKKYEYTQSVYYMNELIKNIGKNLCVRNESRHIYYKDNNLILRLDTIKSTNIENINRTLKKKVLNNDDLLLAFRAIIESAKIFIEYQMDDFIDEFGYGSNLKDIRNAEKIYKQCESTYRKLAIDPCKLESIINNLSKLKIE